MHAQVLNPAAAASAALAIGIISAVAVLLTAWLVQHCVRIYRRHQRRVR